MKIWCFTWIVTSSLFVNVKHLFPAPGQKVLFVILFFFFSDFPKLAGMCEN